MADADLQRVRDDLSSLRQAAGLDLPFGWEDVRLAWLVAGTGGVAVLWTLLVPGRPPNFGLIPLLLVAIGGVVRLRIKYRQSSGRSRARRGEYTLGLVLAGVMVVLMLIYRIWAVRLGMPFRNVQAIAIFFAGLAVAVLALTHRWRMANLALAVPLVMCGLALPFLPVQPATLFGIAMIIGGSALAVVETYQLKRAAVSGYDTH
jgi:hypothetical protein